MSTVIQTQIAAIQARIDALAPEASSEDVVMLAKAVEAVAGQATVFDVLRSGEDAKTQLAAQAHSHSATLAQTTTASLSTLAQAEQAAIDQVSATGHTLANVHAIALVF